MKSIKNFENHYNTLIRKWYRSKYKGVAFIKINGQKPITKTMPEPYYGDIQDNLYSVLFLHPTHKDEDKTYLSRRSMASKLQNLDYAKYAKPFQQLSRKKFHYQEERKWWIKKHKTITMLFHKKKNNKCNDIFNGQLQQKWFLRKPFAIEIYPWHYKNWGQKETYYISSHQSLYQEIDQYVITPFIHAIDKSNLQIGLAITQEAVKILQKYNFKEDTIWQESSHKTIQDWPTDNKGKKIKAKFTYLKIEVRNNSPKDDDKWTNIQGQTSSEASSSFIKVLGIKATTYGELPNKIFWQPGGVICQILQYIKSH